MGATSWEWSQAIDVWLSESGENAGRFAAAGWGALAAAWAGEEQGEAEEARRCRERAVEFWRRAEEAGESITRRGLPVAQLLLAETLRRLGRFEEAHWCCRRGLSGRPADPVRSLLEFEIELLSREDTEAHSVDEAICRRT